MKSLLSFATVLSLSSMAFAEAAEHAGAAKEAASPFAGSIYQGVAAILVFGIVFFILSKTAWGPILKGLTDREAKIKGDLEAAEAASKAAQTTLDQYNEKLAESQGEMRAAIAKAQADAEQLGATLRTRAQQEAQQLIETAKKEIENEKLAAKREIETLAAELSTTIAEKILRRNINAQDQQDLVRSALEQLNAVKN